MADKLQKGKFNSFTIVSNGLIETDLLTEHEKIVYIVIRKHLNQERQTAFPGMATIAREARICKSVVIKAIQGLEEKGLLTVKRQTSRYNEKKTNIYCFNDFAELWKAKTVDELKKIATETIQITDDEVINRALHIEREKRKKLYNQLAKEFEKEKELTSAPTKVTDVSAHQSNNTNQSDNTINTKKSQERYTADQIRQLFDYNTMITDHPDSIKDIDTVFDILYDALNRTSPFVRIDGQDRSAMAVIGRLMRLEPADLWYAICKYHEQTGRIKNVRAYLLTILYHAKEQSYLDLTNLGHHNGDF